MVPGGRGDVHHNVTALAPADHILPMGNGDLLSASHGQPAPDFRLPPEGHQRNGAPKQQQPRRDGGEVPEKADIHTGIGSPHSLKRFQKDFPLCHHPPLLSFVLLNYVAIQSYPKFLL